MTKRKKITLIKKLPRLDAGRIYSRIKSYRLNLKNNAIRWRNSISNYKQDRNKYLSFIIENLEKNSPASIIKRGFAVVHDAESGKSINSIKLAVPGNIIDILLKDGTIKAKVKKIIFKKLKSGRKSEN